MKASDTARLCLCLFGALTVLAAALPAYAANKISLDCDKNQLSTSDILRCEVVLTLEDEDGIGPTRHPDYKGFKVISSNTSHQSMTSIVNFKMTSSKTATTVTMLQPTQAGVFTIGPASFQQNGRQVSSNTFRVKVSDVEVASSANHFGDEAITAPLTDSEQKTPYVFLRLIPERSTLVAGEQMAVTLYLYAASNSQVRRWGQVAPSIYNGFGSEKLELPKNGRARNAVIGRTSYHIEALDRYLLTAREVGRHTISAYQGKLLIGEDAFFGGRWTHRASAPIEIEILPLPEEGRPARFNREHVGRFQIMARIDRRRTEVGQPVALKLTLKGNRNLDHIHMPKPGPIKGAKTYPPTEEKQSFQKGSRFSGLRKAEYLIVPNRPGKIVIGPVSFNYFDTEQNAYKTIRTKSYTIQATPASGKAAANGQAIADKQTLEIGEGALRPLHPSARFESAGSGLFGSGIFLALFWGPLAVILLVWLVDLLRLVAARLGTDEDMQLKKKAKKLQEKLSSMAVSPDETFYTELRKWIHYSLELKTGLSVSGLTHEQISSRLSESGFDEDSRNRIISLLEKIDFASHAPGASGYSSSDLFDSAIKLLDGRQR